MSEACEEFLGIEIRAGRFVEVLGRWDAPGRAEVSEQAPESPVEFYRARVQEILELGYEPLDPGSFSFLTLSFPLNEVFVGASSAVFEAAKPVSSVLDALSLSLMSCGLGFACTASTRGAYLEADCIIVRPRPDLAGYVGQCLTEASFPQPTVIKEWARSSHDSGARVRRWKSLGYFILDEDVEFSRPDAGRSHSRRAINRRRCCHSNYFDISLWLELKEAGVHARGVDSVFASFTGMPADSAVLQFSDHISVLISDVPEAELLALKPIARHLEVATRYREMARLVIEAGLIQDGSLLLNAIQSAFDRGPAPLRWLVAQAEARRSGIRLALMGSIGDQGVNLTLSGTRGDVAIPERVVYSGLPVSNYALGMCGGLTIKKGVVTVLNAARYPLFEIRVDELCGNVE